MYFEWGKSTNTEFRSLNFSHSDQRYNRDDAWRGQNFLFYVILLFQLPWLNIVHGINTRHSIKMDMKDK